jgi:hypothetical protein
MKPIFLYVILGLFMQQINADNLALIPTKNFEETKSLFENPSLTINFYRDEFVIATLHTDPKEDFIVLDNNPWSNGLSYYLVYIDEHVDKEKYYEVVNPIADVLHDGNYFLIVRIDEAIHGQLPPAKNDGMVRLFGNEVELPVQRFAFTEQRLDPDPFVVSLLNEVSGTNITADVQHLEDYVTRNAYHANSVLAQNWIESRFIALEFDNVEVMDFTMPGGAASDNVIATLTGTKYPDEYVVLGAHYDSYSYSGDAPGADDNASGTAGVLEIARILSQYQFDRTIIFCAFSGEEYGLYGSKAYASRAAQEGMNILGYFNMDMIGYLEPGHTTIMTSLIYPQSAKPLGDFYTTVAGVYLPDFVVTPSTFLYGDSDHTAFNLNGFMGIFPFEDAQNYSPYIHTANDVVGTSYIREDQAVIFTKAILASVVTMANMGDPPVVGLPCSQDFSEFSNNETLPAAWSLDDTYVYQGDFGSGTTGGLRGNGALGFQLTESSPNDNFTATLELINDTGEEITELWVKYSGLVERTDQTGMPEWVVSVNGVEYTELEYSTEEGDNRDVFALISGLSIAEYAFFEIGWFTTSAGTSGTCRQIGITDVEIEVPVTYNGITDPENLPPDATVIVSGNQTLDIPLHVKNLVINNDNSLLISPVGTLTVTGVIGNNAGADGLLIKSAASGTGSLIHFNPGLHGTSERYIPAHSGAKSATGWHFLSSPVNDFAIGSSDFEPGLNDDFYAWDEAGNLWLNYKDGANNITNFTNGQGYLVAYAGDLTGVFTGTFNVGDVAVDLNLTPSKDNFNGWNLLGNPYPSAIDWSVVGNHTDTFEDVFAYVYNRGKTGGAGYEEIDGSQQGAFIPANQGFFVKTKASGSFTFTNNMRVHGGNFMKSSPADDRIVLRFAGDHYFDQTTLRLRKGSQFSRDPLDALKMFSFDTDVPQIYTVTTDQRGVAINSIPAVDESLVIPVGLVVPANGEMTIMLKELSGEFENLFVLLLDQKTGVTHKFVNDQDGYTFDASTDDTDRFLLKFMA